MAQAKPLSFPSDVFERLEPDIYLKRHLELGLRPSALRKLDEFRNTTVHLGTLNTESTIGSAVMRMGGTTVICGITAGITESLDGGGIYPNVEIVRGGSRSGPPSEEEMILSQRVYQLLLESGIYEKDLHNFEIQKGIDDKFLVLSASIQVLSRTGPCFDIVWNCIIAALKNSKIPYMSFDVDLNDIICDKDQPPRSLNFPSDKGLGLFSSTFGITETEDNKNVVIADLEGSTEEACITSRINIVGNSNGELTGVSITVSGGNGVFSKDEAINLTKSEILHALTVARNRSAQLDQIC